MKAQKQAFQTLKNKFKKESILIYFNYNKKGVIDADTLKKTIEARLQQRDE